MSHALTIDGGSDSFQVKKLSPLDKALANFPPEDHEYGYVWGDGNFLARLGPGRPAIRGLIDWHKRHPDIGPAPLAF